MKNVKEYRQIDPEDLIFSQILLHNIKSFDVVPICGTEFNLDDLEEGEKILKGDGKNYSILLTPKKPKLMSKKQAEEKAFAMFTDCYVVVEHSSSIGLAQGPEKICSVYVSDHHKHYTGTTYEKVFAQIENYMLTKDQKEPTKEESEQITEDIIPEG